MIRLRDRLVIAAAVIAAGYMAVRGPYLPVNDLLPGGRAATALYLLAALIVTVGLLRIARAHVVARVIETRAAGTGTLECTTRRPVGYDRAGPALAGGLLIFADHIGTVEAMSRSQIVGCDRTAP